MTRFMLLAAPGDRTGCWHNSSCASCSLQVVIIRTATKCLSIFGLPTETEPRAGVYAADAADAAASLAATQFKISLQKNGTCTLQSISTGQYLTAVREGQSSNPRLGIASNNAVSTGRVPSAELSFLVLARAGLQALAAGTEAPIVTQASEDALVWMGPALELLAAQMVSTDAPLNLVEILAESAPVLDLDSTPAPSGAVLYPTIPFSAAGGFSREQLKTLQLHALQL